MNADGQAGSVINTEALPPQFPKHEHDGRFWESLGRTVATFGFLEEMLAKAIFAFTATRPYSEVEIHKAYAGWTATLEKALVNPLSNLIDVYAKAVREHPSANIQNCADLESDLRAASKTRNVLCHASWRPPNADGFSLPVFVNRQLEVVDTQMDVAYLTGV